MKILIITSLCLFLWILMSGCGGMNAEWGGMRFQTGAQPDTRSRSVFGPQDETYQIIQAQPEIQYAPQKTTTVRRRYNSAPKAVLPPAACPIVCPTVEP